MRANRMPNSQPSLLIPLREILVGSRQVVTPVPIFRSVRNRLVLQNGKLFCQTTEKEAALNFDTPPIALLVLPGSCFDGSTWV